MLTWRLSGLSVCIKWSRHASKERATRDEGTKPEECMMRGYKGRKELQKWWEHVLGYYVQICNTRSKAVHLWKKVTGSISWRLKMYEHSLLYYVIHMLSSFRFQFWCCTSFPPLPFIATFSIYIVLWLLHKFSNICKPEEGWYGQPRYCYKKQYTLF